MKKLTKVLAMILAVIILSAAAVSCSNDNKTKPTEEPAASPTPGSSEKTYNDAAETVTYVAKAGDQLIYSNEFYYFLYQAVRELYYKADGVYDPNATDEENLAKMREFFNSEDEEGVTYLRRAADRTLEIAQGFKIAYKEGKELATKDDAKYKVDETELSQIISYIDSEADYGAAMYGCSRDEYFSYVYGMTVNDAKRYTKQQVYAELHENYWADANGWVIGMDEPKIPEEPEKPSEPAENASDEDKAAYQTKLEEYNTKKAEYDEALEQYKTDYAKYEELKKAYYEKFREEYEENQNIYGYRTVRALYLSKKDSEGKDLSEEEIETKKKNIETYISLVEQGHSFDSIVKGFSEASDAATTMGLVDVNVYTTNVGNLPNEVIDWAFAKDAVSLTPELVETETGLYLVTVEGIVTFDEALGIVVDSETANVESVRKNVEYSKLATLYNDYIKELMAKEEYAIKDVDYDAALELAKKYIDFTTEDSGLGGRS